MSKKKHQHQTQFEPESLPLVPAETAAVEHEFKVISLDLIDEPQQAMRTNITPLSVEDLVMSIKQVGLIEPIVVKPKGGRYEIIAGHRRFFAHQVAKLTTIQCYVRNVSTDESEMMKIHENLYREDIRPSDEARHFENMMRVYKMTPNKIAQLIGKSDGYVKDRLDIFEYPPYLKEAMDKKQISFSVAKEFYRLDDPQTIVRFTHYAVRNGMTSETAKKWVADEKRSKEQPQVETNSIYNGTTGQQEVESMSQCIYCKDKLRLMEAEVVYMHPDCAQQANEYEPTPAAVAAN